MGGGRRKVGGQGAPGARYRDDKREEYLGIMTVMILPISWYTMKGGEKQLGKKQMIPILETKRNSGTFMWRRKFLPATRWRRRSWRARWRGVVTIFPPSWTMIIIIVIVIIVITTRPETAFCRPGLDWTAGPYYSYSRFICEFSWCLAWRLRRSARKEEEVKLEAAKTVLI